ncbi:hypothetical protein RQM20_007010 [Citrobacter freundii]|uniref:hypothetical protein n=1 Tax=Citrobacter freundii TaxID=546 RepID=UPI0028BDD4C7|nr:hypothetical protein [Citrobacter freundii]MDT7344771.1 hypothetical protein [Citrobacter freundii]
MTVYEMEGFLRGKCLPGDMMVNEGNAQYLVRKFSELQSQNADLAVQLANAESKCRELAAENVTLNDKMNKLATWPGIEFYSSSWEFCNLDGNDALEFMCDVQTPATEAFLAEVRARAVDDACLKISNAIINCYQDEQVGLDAAATICGDFASEIRKGAEL